MAGNFSTDRSAFGEATRGSRLTRRRFLHLAALLGGGAAVNALLVACGSSGSSAPTVPAQTQGSGAGNGTAAAGVGGTSSGNPTAATNQKLASDQTLRYVDTEPPVMDPGISDAFSDQYIDYNVWEGLVRYDEPTSSFIPLGATHWDISADGVTYTFHLRDGVNWTDGTPVTAQDYEWAWKRNLDPKTGAQGAQLLYPVKGAASFNGGKGSADDVGVKAVDDKTFQVTLEGPAGYFLNVATQTVAFPLPRAVVQKLGSKWVEPPNVVSNGPFKLDKWEHDVRIVISRNEQYWGPKPTLSQVTYTLYTDVAKSSLPAFENNEIDYAEGPWPADIDRIRSDATLSKQLHIFPMSSTTFLCFDTANSQSPVSKVGVRKALSLAIDREQLTQNVFKGIYEPAYTIVPAGIPGANPNAKLSGGVKEAQQALAAAGYPGGKGVSLILPYRSNTNNDLVMQVLQQMWQENLGIKLELHPMEAKAYTAYRQTLKTTPYDLYLGGYGSDYLDDYDWLNFQFASESDFWYTHWKNDEFEKLIAEAAVDIDQKKRTQLYSQAEAILASEASVVPLYHSASVYLIKPWVIDYVHTLIGFDLFFTTKIAQH